MTTKHRPIKSLGQNFLVDSRIQQKIVDSCFLKADDTVIEIGPGQAALTSKVLPLVKSLIVVEKDRELAALLKEKYREPQLEVVQGDFLKWDMTPLSNDLVVIGNIPYYISTPIIEKLLAHKDKIRRAYLTVQLEFGQRLAAQAGSKDYGSLSCFVQYYADVKVLFKISAGSFHPKPKVDSCFISLTIKPKPEVKAQYEERLFKMIQTAFMQRRKTITNALKGFAGGIDWASMLKELSIDPQARPEDLTLLNYISISNKLVV
jgi:16S rRNA (adenine1518-N6/adenine1519-N6)-dimethyltransferase